MGGRIFLYSFEIRIFRSFSGNVTIQRPKSSQSAADRNMRKGETSADKDLIESS